MKVNKKTLERAGFTVKAGASLSDVSRELMENRQILEAIKAHTYDTSRKVGAPIEFPPAPPKRPMSYRFTVQRDDKGRIMEILATPLKEA